MTTGSQPDITSGIILKSLRTSGRAMIPDSTLVNQSSREELADGQNLSQQHLTTTLSHVHWVPS